jgi:hypothetical protein
VAHADLDLLFDHLINLAKKFLNSQRGFYPFGAMVKTGGDIQYVAARDDTAPDPDKPDSKVLLRLLRKTFHSEVQMRTIRAFGICVDVFVTDFKTGEKSDAIQCSFEHRDGDSMNVFIKYSRDEAGDFIYGQPYSTDREREFFPDPDFMPQPRDTIN